MPDCLPSVCAVRVTLLLNNHYLSATEVSHLRSCSLLALNRGGKSGSTKTSSQGSTESEANFFHHLLPLVHSLSGGTFSPCCGRRRITLNVGTHCKREKNARNQKQTEEEIDSETDFSAFFLPLLKGNRREDFTSVGHHYPAFETITHICQ